jgi:hypothetical protein
MSPHCIGWSQSANDVGALVFHGGNVGVHVPPLEEGTSVGALVKDASMWLHQVLFVYSLSNFEQLLSGRQCLQIAGHSCCVGGKVGIRVGNVVGVRVVGTSVGMTVVGG